MHKRPRGLLTGHRPLGMVFNNSIESSISTERFDSYPESARNDEHAWQLYRWNLELAAPSLRLDDQTHKGPQDVVQNHRKKLNKKSVGPGRVTADLTLGTWVMLLGRGGFSILKGNVDYEAQLWRSALRNGFATGQTNSRGMPTRPLQSTVHQRSSNLQQLRNATAHQWTTRCRRHGCLDDATGRRAIRIWAV